MQVGWDGGTNAVGMAWWHKCSWIGLVAQIQLECADDTNAAGLEWRHKCSRIGQVVVGGRIRGGTPCLVTGDC